MPLFLKRIFTDNPFRRDRSPTDNIQRSRRVLVRNMTVAPGGSSSRLPFANIAAPTEERIALRDGASIAASSTHATEQHILAPSLAKYEQPVSTTKSPRTRRRLSKKHRRPV